jgi:hypothetical protein
MGRESTGFFQAGNGGSRGGFLFGRSEEDGGPVILADLHPGGFGWWGCEYRKKGPACNTNVTSMAKRMFMVTERAGICTR